MGGIRKRWRSLGVQQKLHILIQGSLIVIFFVSMEWVLGRFEEQIMASAEVRAEETADGLINGMNMLMLTGAIINPDNRKLLLSKMRQSEGIHELRIIRGKSVAAQFGKGLPEEQPVDDLDREVLETGKTRFKRIDVAGGAPLLRVVVPFIAQENFRGTNCLSCHVVEAGSVNGVASVVIDLSKEESELQSVKNWLWAGHIAIQIFLSIIISWFVRVLIVKHIAEPVKKLQTAMTEIQREHDLSKRADVDEANPDIGEMARAFNALVDNLEHATERLELFGKMFHGSGEAILITDTDRNIVAVNPAFTEITGYEPHEVVGKNPNVLSSGKQTPDFYQTMWASINEAGQWQGEIWNRRKSGEVYPEWLSIGVVKNGKGEVINYISLFSDITERKAAEQKIEFLAHYDALTRLPNRALFADRLKLALIAADRHEKKVALLFLDLDKFKTINDTMGHLAGDMLLQSVAERLRSCVRESDTICRQGGDEFMILLSEVGSKEQVENVAKKIIAAMVVPHRIAEQEIVVTFSVGISLFPDNAGDSEAMVRCADDAMYRAKERGRNNYQFC
ncbi:MAG: sensor domain-containing diguanylate cyclase [Gallionellaceae bacterium]|nr:MAG: sensor domain-containing diguanylate cyclase [Gallionellaceae bacterium]